MKIGINTRLLLPHRMEGIARYTWEITKRMILSHPEDEFILFFDRTFDPQFIIAKNVKGIVILPQSRHPILWKIWFDFSIKRALKKHKIDVFFSPESYTSLTTKVPQLMVIHDLTYLHFPESMRKEHLSYLNKNIPLFYQKADHVVAVSEFTKRDIVERFGQKEEEISVTYNALDKQITYAEESIVDGDFFLYLGSIHPRKNIIRLIEAYEGFRIKNPELSPKLVLAGRKAFGNDQLEVTLEKLNFKSDILFLGMVDEAQKFNLLRQAKLFVYVSFFEGFGIPILEAMQAGLPIITSSEGALSEVSNGVGIGVNPQNTLEISEAFETMYLDKKLRASSIKAGKERIKDFSWDQSASKIYQQLQKLNKSN